MPGARSSGVPRLPSCSRRSSQAPFPAFCWPLAQQWGRLQHSLSKQSTEAVLRALHHWGFTVPSNLVRKIFRRFSAGRGPGMAVAGLTAAGSEHLSLPQWLSSRRGVLRVFLESFRLEKTLGACNEICHWCLPVRGSETMLRAVLMYVQIVQWPTERPDHSLYSKTGYWKMVCLMLMQNPNYFQITTSSETQYI